MIAEEGFTVVSSPSGVRMASLLAIRGVLRLAVKGVPMGDRPRNAMRGLKHWYPDQPIPRTYGNALAWLEDRIEAETGRPLLHRYTPRPDHA